MTKNLVIVESPAKVKTLKKYFGSNYKVEASMGHVRDLPKSDLGVDIDNDFEPRYITIRGKGDLLKKLRKEVKGADKVYLATDPDREGEAISWHLYHALNLEGKQTYRITFNEITKNAVKQSLKEAREIDMSLVDAQQARRVLDRIVGYKLSPLLWGKVKKGLSAGRVQSVLVKMICDREDEIEAFEPVEYWSMDAELLSGKKKLTAKFYGTAAEKIELKTKEQVDAILAEIEPDGFTVKEIKKGQRSSKPPLPFTTSTMQQEASRSLNFTAIKTMSVAQNLYEGIDIKGRGTLGLITYIRTDSTRISDAAYDDAKAYITENYGAEYCIGEKIEPKQKGRTQDAHEAIRPTDLALTPDSVKESLSKDEFKLYSLVWERFCASQMGAAIFDTISARIQNGGYVFRASGSVLRFAGYKLVYKKEEQDKSETETIPELKEGESLTLSKMLPEQHFTQPPPRFNEAMIVKTLEENGVGRPSTYAPTIATVVNRGYVLKENKVFFPTELGEIVNEIMADNFGDIVDIEFTSRMENELDEVEEGAEDWKKVIRDFYPAFAEKLNAALVNVAEVEIKDQETDIICENCGRNMVIKLGKFGKFLACPGFPECRNTKPLFEDAGVPCPKCGAKVFVKKTKKGRRYYACENGEDCGFISWNKPTGEKCPVCGEALVEKGKGKKMAVCPKPECGFKKEIKETED